MFFSFYRNVEVPLHKYFQDIYLLINTFALFFSYNKTLSYNIQWRYLLIRGARKAPFLVMYVIFEMSFLHITRQ